jgi:hypothetical protein
MLSEKLDPAVGQAGFDGRHAASRLLLEKSAPLGGGHMVFGPFPARL